MNRLLALIFFCCCCSTLLLGQGSTFTDSLPALDSYYDWESIDPYFHRSIPAKDKAQALYQQADLYYRKGDYERARELCYSALRYQPGWGKPHFLVGIMYASSGQRCSPATNGLGFHAQVLVWAAIEEWQQAALDPLEKEEATSYIQQYLPYLPYPKDYEEQVPAEQKGPLYYIPCWIQRPVKVWFNKASN